MNVPMTLKTDDGQEEFTLVKLEMVGRIEPDGLDIEVNSISLLKKVDDYETKLDSNTFRPAAARLLVKPKEPSAMT